MQENGYAIQYINDPSEEVQRLAIQQNGLVIRFVHNSSEEIQRLAIENNPDCIKYIDVKKYPELYEFYKLRVM